MARAVTFADGDTLHPADLITVGFDREYQYQWRCVARRCVYVVGRDTASEVRDGVGVNLMQQPIGSAPAKPILPGPYYSAPSAPFHFNPADLAAPGRRVQILVVLDELNNGQESGQAIRASLYPVLARPAGTTPTDSRLTIGTAVPLTKTSSIGQYQNHALSSIVSAPNAGDYVIGYTTTSNTYVTYGDNWQYDPRTQTWFLPSTTHNPADTKFLTARLMARVV